MHARTHVREATAYRQNNAHFSALADSVTFNCDGTSSMCANDGTLIWSCSEKCTSPSDGCSIELSQAGLRGTIPAALGDVRCAPWIINMCVPCGRKPYAPSGS